MRFSWINRDFKRITLKKFLKRHGISHRLFYSIKHGGLMMINQKPVRTSLPLKIGDQASVTMPPERSNPDIKVSRQPIRIVHEDPNWLVINKPAGLTSVPGPSNDYDTVVNRVKGHLLADGSPNLRPHIITRLDRFTSGVMLIAKHRLANSLANQLLAKKQIQKEYLALVSGHLEHAHGNIKMPIGKLPNEIRRHRMSSGRPAWTEYRVVKNYTRYTLVRVKLHTGRTHQIRVHFTEKGHPLVGDHLYHGPLNLGMTRQALHAFKLKFRDPFTQRNLHFKVKLPEDMQKMMR